MTQEEKKAFANGHLIGKILVEYAAHAKIRDGKRHCEMDWKEFQRLALYFYDLGKVEQKPAGWNKEDEKAIAHIVRILDDCYIYGRHDLSEIERENLIKTLKSLRLQPKQVWTEEDDRICHLIMANLSESTRHAITLPMETVNMFNNWLRTLQCMPPLFTDWTDEDEMLLSDALACVTMVQEIKKRGELKNFHISCTGEELRSWIRSLKSRPRKQPHWKPSEEQMEALKYFVNHHQGFASQLTTKWDDFEELKSLYNDLKKLI